MKMEWCEEYSTGNEALDEQHKHWISLYNRLDQTMLEKKIDVLNQVKNEILQEMSDYVDYHFAFEEEFMESINYPDKNRHWRMHKDFRNRIYSICRDHEDGAIVLNTEILGTIRKWMHEHIIGQDGKIGEYLKTSPDNPK